MFLAILWDPLGLVRDWFGDALEYFWIPNCTIIDFPEIQTARLMFFKKISPLHVYSVLHV
jgi:hypothetical protein